MIIVNKCNFQISLGVDDRNFSYPCARVSSGRNLISSQVCEDKCSYTVHTHDMTFYMLNLCFILNFMNIKRPATCWGYCHLLAAVFGGLITELKYYNKMLILGDMRNKIPRLSRLFLVDILANYEIFWTNHIEAHITPECWLMLMWGLAVNVIGVFCQISSCSAGLVHKGIHVLFRPSKDTSWKNQDTTSKLLFIKTKNRYVNTMSNLEIHKWLDIMATGQIKRILKFIFPAFRKSLLEDNSSIIYGDKLDFNVKLPNWNFIHYTKFAKMNLSNMKMLLKRL